MNRASPVAAERERRREVKGKKRGRKGPQPNLVFEPLICVLHCVRLGARKMGGDVSLIFPSLSIDLLPVPVGQVPGHCKGGGGKKKEPSPRPSVPCSAPIVELSRKVCAGKEGKKGVDILISLLFLPLTGQPKLFTGCTKLW